MMTFLKRESVIAYHSYDNLPWQILHSLLVYIQYLTTAPGNRLFGSVVRALDIYSSRPGLTPMIDGIFFHLCLIPLLRLLCCKIGAVRDRTLFH